jgi:23S rRNA maturation mini-RNase III
MDEIIDKLTQKYVELRDRKAAIEKEAEKQKAKLTQIMNAIANKIKEILYAQGATSMTTPHGTPYIAYRESATVAALA